MINTKQNIKIKQDIKLTPQLINFLNILQLNSIELESMIKEEFEENPMLEYVAGNRSVPIYSSVSRDSEKNSYENYVSEEETLETLLLNDLKMYPLDNNVKNIIESFIYNLDESGFLPYSKEELLKITGNPPEEIFDKALFIFRDFEPVGIGSSNIKECLIKQAEECDFCENKEQLVNLIENYFEDLKNMNLKEISKKMKISEGELKSLVDDFRDLNPIPSSGYLRSGDEPTEYVYPDIFLDVEDGVLKVRTEENLEPYLKISDSYLNILENSEGETKEYLLKNLNKAKMLIQNIEQRKKTVKAVTEAIADIQKDYFLKDGNLKPMNLEAVAEKSGVSVSTVSRVTKNKYIGTNRGVFPMSYLFSNKIYNDNEVSSDKIKTVIKEIIESENRKSPLSDNKICAALNEKNIKIARRTVAKYREELEYPSASKRKKLYEMNN